MKIDRKRETKIRQIKKCKVRRNVDVSIMKTGINYDRVYSPVLGLISIRILFILVVLEGWKTIQVDYVQAFSQVPIEKDLYLKVPAGYQV